MTLSSPFAMSSFNDEPCFPLYPDEEKKSPDGPFIIGVCGASASGKSSVCNRILEDFKYSENVTIISLDSFYKELSPAELELVHKGIYDFDSPDAFDWDLVSEVLQDLRAIPPKSVEIPEYDFCTHRRGSKKTIVYAVDIVLLEGILTFHDGYIFLFQKNILLISCF